MATIIIFASSLFVMLALVTLKAIELKYGRKNIFLRFIGMLDSKSDKLVADLRFRWMQISQSIRYIVLVQSKAVFKSLLDRIEERIANEYRIRHTMIMGHKEIATNKGSVSFYLKKITEEKSTSHRGKIE